MSSYLSLVHIIKRAL